MASQHRCSAQPNQGSLPNVHHPQRWIFGENSKIYNYDLFDPNESFGGLTVLEIDPATPFQVRDASLHRAARWSETPKGVGTRKGSWVRDFADGHDCSARAPSAGHFAARANRALPIISTGGSAGVQMSWREFGRISKVLHRAGF